MEMTVNCDDVKRKREAEEKIDSYDSGEDDAPISSLLKKQRPLMNTSAAAKKLQDIKLLEYARATNMRTAAQIASLSPLAREMLDSGMTFEEAKQALIKKQQGEDANNPWTRMIMSDISILQQCKDATGKVQNLLSGLSDHRAGEGIRNNPLQGAVLSPEAIEYMTRGDEDVISAWEEDLFQYVLSLNNKKD
jgi:hypothetical protein